MTDDGLSLTGHLSRCMVTEFRPFMGRFRHFRFLRSRRPVQRPLRVASEVGDAT